MEYRPPTHIEAFGDVHGDTHVYPGQMSRHGAPVTLYLPLGHADSDGDVDPTAQLYPAVQLRHGWP